MNDQVLQHIMNLQTQMLQQMTRMQQEQLQQESNFTNTDPTQFTESLNQTNQNASPISTNPASIQNATGNFGTPLPNAIASPVTPPLINNAVAPGTLTMSVNNPTEYGTYAAPNTDGRRLSEAADTTLKNFVSTSISEMRDYDAMRHSKEAADVFISQQSRGIQEQSADMLGTAIGGVASLGTLFVPGILPGLAAGAGVAMGVGGASSAISGEVREALNYQEILQREGYRFINRFESQNDLGGIGFSLAQRQESSGFLRELSTENFLNEQEMTTILQGATDNSLLKSVSDVESFRNKMTDLVGAVKDIAISLNATYEEATEFMGEMERRGIATRDMPFVAAQARVTGSFLGQSANEVMGTVLNQTDTIVQGTALDAGQVMQGASQSMFIAQRVQDLASQQGDDSTYQYSKNVGGAGNAGAQMDLLARQFLQSESGQSRLRGFFAAGFRMNEEGEFEIDRQMMNRLLSGQYSMEEMQQMSTDYTNSLGVAQRNRLANTAGSIFENQDALQLNLFLQQNAAMTQESTARTGTEIDMQTALVESGITSDWTQAGYLEKYLGEATNEQVIAAFNAQSARETIDSNAIANAPSLTTRASYWFERNFRNRLGNFGQNVADDVGSAMQDYQLLIANIQDRSLTITDELPPLDQEGIEKYYNTTGTEMKSAYESAAEYLSDREDEETDFFRRASLWRTRTQLENDIDDVEEIKSNNDVNNPMFSQGSFDVLMNDIYAGNATAVDMRNIQGLVDSGDLGFIENYRAQMTLRAGSGEYRGFGGNLRYLGERVGLGALNVGMDFWESAGFGFEGFDTTTEQLLDNAERLGKQVEEETNRVNSELVNFFRGDELGITDQEQLGNIEQLIRAGDVEGVRTATNSNQRAIELAEEYSSIDALDLEATRRFANLPAVTATLAEGVDDIGAYLKGSGAYTDEEIDSLFGDLQKEGDKTLEDIEDMTTEELLEASQSLGGGLSEIFSSMTPTRAKEVAEYLAAQGQAKYDELLVDGSQETIDTRKLNVAMLEMVRNTHLQTDVNNPDKKASSIDPEEAEEVAEEHVNSFSNLISSWRREIDLMNQASGTGTSSQTYNQSSLQTYQGS
jgi:hypothetical protein